MFLNELQPSVSVAINSSRTPSNLWTVVADPLVQTLFSTELQSIRILGDDPVGLGTRFIGEQLRGNHRWLSYSEVTVYERERTFAWNVRLTDDESLPVCTWSLSLSALPTGTRLEELVVLHGGASPVTTKVEGNPDSAYDTVEQTLALFAQSMMTSLRGLERLATH